MCRQCETEKYPSGNLFVSKVSLVLPLFHRHFKDGQLKLRCSAHITNVYQRNADVVLKQVAGIYKNHEFILLKTGLYD